MTTCAIYTRLSQDRDGKKEGTGRQEADCRALAKRERLKVVEVYKDDDRSAYSGKARPAFDRMLAELDRFDVVIYWKTDRLVRRMTQFVKVLDACQKANVRLVSVVDPIDTSSPLGQGVAALLASVGENESHNIGLRVRRANDDAAVKGSPHGGRRPFGYEADGLAIVPAEAEAIRDARDRLLAGDTMGGILRDWNERGIVPAWSPAWRVTSFRRMILSPRIAGLRQHRGDVVGKAAWPGIISPEDRDRLLALLTGPRARRPGRPGSYLLSGLLVCGRCGQRLHSGVRARSGRVWHCSTQPGDTGRCGRMSIIAEPVDELVEAALVLRLDSPALARALRRKVSGSGKAAAKNVTDLEQRITQLGLDLDAGIVDRREWLARRGPLIERLETARAELEPVTPTAGAKELAALAEAADIPGRWKQLDLDQRRNIASAMIDRITIMAPVPGAAGRFDPDRVDIAWRA